MPNDKELKYLTINDFSPGIVSDYRLASEAAAPNLVADAAKPGEAVGFVTFSSGFTFYTRGCYATPQGKLAALPFGRPRTGGQIGPINPSPSTFVDTAGLAAVPNVFLGGDDLFCWVHCLSTTPRDVMQVYRGNVLLKTHVGTSTTVGPPRGVTYTLSRGRRANFGTPGGPELFYEWTSGEPHSDGSVYFYEVFPDPNATNTDTTYEETATINNAAFTLGGQIAAHSGRILRFCEQSTPFGLTNVFFSNERVRNTDPPNSVSLTSTTTDSILDPQYPGTFGAWGSLSFGELLLVKQYGGAILVEGDVYAPQITRLPAVQSTGVHVSQMAWSIPGLVYMTEDGPYVWQGGSSSQRIGYPSGLFRFPASYLPNASPHRASGWSCSVISWNNLVIFSGGVVWDSAAGAWWTLNQPQTVGNLVWFAPSIANRADPGIRTTFYAVVDRLDGSNLLQLFNYSNTSCDQWTWVSQPLPTGYDTIDIVSVECSFGAIPNVPNLQCFVNFVDISGQQSSAITFNIAPPNSGQTLRLRQPCGVRASTLQPIITMTSVGGNTLLPILNSITIGYKEAGRFGAQP